MGQLRKAVADANAEKQARDLEQRVYADVPLGLCHFDEQLRCRHINAWLANLNRLSAEAHLGLPIHDVFPAQFPKRDTELRAILEGRASVFRCEAHAETAAHPGIKKHYAQSYRAHRVDGVTRGISCVVEDITHAMESESRMRSIVNAIPTALVMVDSARRIVLVNDATEELLGYAREQLLGRPLSTLIPQSLREYHHRHVDDFFAAPRSRRMSTSSGLLALRKDGATIEIDVGLCPVPTTHGMSVLASLVDVTERERAMEAMVRAMRLKDEFLAGMSHELRTPLSAILGVTEALRELVYGPISAAQLEPLRTVEASAQHLLSLIDDVLDLSRLEAGKTEIDPQNVNVGELCVETMQLVRPQAAAGRLHLSTTIEEGLSELQADPRRLKQILLNLLSNAIKFTPEEGQVGLRVYRAADGATVAFAVRDTGLGIPDEKLHLLFKPFVQLDHGLSRRHPGAGLGLALSNHLAQLHGGRITVKSKLGEGSTFTLTVPRVQARGDRRRNTAPPYEEPVDDPLLAPGPAADAPLVLIVDDTPANVGFVCDYLRRRGFRVETAQSGQRGIEMARSLSPSAIVMDIQMPGMDGLEAIQRLRNEERTRDIFVVAVTGLALPSDRERCMAAGANAYLPKPYSLRALQKILNHAVGSQSDS